MGLFGKDPPDPAKGYAAGVNADIQTAPARRMIEALARLGESGYVDLPGRGGKSKRQFYDFTGLGEADVQRQYGDQMMGQMLAVQRDFGPQYVEQRLKELEAADPAGAAMRRQLWSTIQTGASTMTDRSDNQVLQDGVLERLNRGSTLDPSVEHQISQGVLGAQVERGNFLGNAAAAEESRVLNSAGESQRANDQAAALAFLTGGLSPQDAAARERQQDMANLGAFLSGETPQAQFNQLAGAQNGAVPFSGGSPLPGVNPYAGWQGVSNQMGVYNANQMAQQNTVNPWVAGLGGAFNGASVWLALGGGKSGGGSPAGLQGGWNSGSGSQYAGQV